MDSNLLGKAKLRKIRCLLAAANINPLLAATAEEIPSIKPPSQIVNSYSLNMFQYMVLFLALYYTGNTFSVFGRGLQH